MRYKIEKERNTYAVYKYGKAISKGFFSIEDALHSIWVMNGSNPKHFYKCVNNEDSFGVVCVGR